MFYSEARKFFMKPQSYFNQILPEYFSFKKVLALADSKLKSSNINDIQVPNKDLKENKWNDINYTLIINKNGKYDWRPLKIIHPVAYVDLINTLTEENNWKYICNKFQKFQKNKSIKCISVPLESQKIHDSDVKQVILNWWNELEQSSIKNALRYSYCIKVDVANCYGSIYTHTITWALHGKEEAKNNKQNKRLLGNIIDFKIQSLQNGQTNGIPQGSVIFDFIAEIVLGYSDFILSDRIKKINDYQIIRYRDDYRIFTNSKETAEQIVRNLSDVLSDLNMHFNEKKTELTTDIIGSAVKSDKLYWNSKKNNICTKYKKQVEYHLGMQKHLLEIYKLSKLYPNSGSVKKALSEFLNRISNSDNRINDYEQLISIISEIILTNPNSVPIGIAILSKIFNIISKKGNKNICEYILLLKNKLATIPNTGYTEIWLQRLSIINNKSIEYNDPLCKKVYNPDQLIWNSKWLSNGFNESSIIDNNIIDDLSLVIPRKQVNIFNPYY